MEKNLKAKVKLLQDKAPKDHFLAYINANEAKLLKKMGGSGEMTPQGIPSLTQTGSQIENIDRQKNLAPFASLQQYAGLVTPIASGFPTQQNQVNTQASPVTTALGGALIGSKFNTSSFGGAGGAMGGALAGLLMGLI